MFIHVKMSTIVLRIVGILTFISMINDTLESLKAKKSLLFNTIVFKELKFHAKLS